MLSLQRDGVTGVTTGEESHHEDGTQASLALAPERHPILQKGPWAHALIRPAFRPAAQMENCDPNSAASPASPRAGFLSGSTIDISDQIIFFLSGWESCPVHRRMFSGIPGFHPLDVPVSDNKNCLWTSPDVP